MDSSLFLSLIFHIWSHPLSEKCNKETESQQKAEITTNSLPVFPVSPLLGILEKMQF